MLRERRINTPDISITKNDNESTAIAEGLGLLCASQMIHHDDAVVITPNWVQPKAPDTGVTSGTESLREIIRFVKDCHPRRIVIATGSGSKDTSEVMNAVGYGNIIREEGVEFVDLNQGPFRRITLPHDSPHETNINTLYDEMTVLISFTQLKHHREATMSACIKNIALGWPPAMEHGFPKKNLGIHEKLHGFIAAMAKSITIDLSILSAQPAMLGTGPDGGVPKHTGLVICGTDPVAADAVGASLLGFQPQAIAYLYECALSGIGVGDTKKMNMHGLPLAEAEKVFSLCAYGQPVVIEQYI